MLIRKIGKIVRGDVSPIQILLACKLAGILSFIPSFATAPGLVVTMALCLLIFNANLMIAALVAALGKLLSIWLAPMAYELGHFLLEGPLQGLFKCLINMPVFALWGLEYYSTTGALILGAVYGGILGCILVVAIRMARSKLATLEGASTEQPGWLKLTLWFTTGQGKGDYQQYLSGKMGNPFRTFGLALVAVVFLLLLMTPMIVGSIWGTNFVKAQMEKHHGATVDLNGISLSVLGGSISVNGLAAANPDALDKDLVRAKAMTANINMLALLKKQIALDEIKVLDVEHDAKRATPGQRFDKSTASDKPSKPSVAKSMTDLSRLSDLFSNTETLTDTLSSIKKFKQKLPSFGQTEKKPEATKTPTTPFEKIHHKAKHLVTDKPIRITRLMVSPIKTPLLMDETLTVTGQDLALNLNAIESGETMIVTLTSSNKTFNIEMNFNKDDQNKLHTRVNGKVNDLAVDKVASNVKLPSDMRLQGGDIDVVMSGNWQGGLDALDIPVTIKLDDAALATKRYGKLDLDDFEFDVTVKGSATEPRFDVNTEAFAKLFLQAGEQAAKNLIDGEVSKVIDKQKLGEKLKDEKLGQDIEDAAKKLFKGIFGE